MLLKCVLAGPSQLFGIFTSGHTHFLDELIVSKLFHTVPFPNMQLYIWPVVLLHNTPDVLLISSPLSVPHLTLPDKDKTPGEVKGTVLVF